MIKDAEKRLKALELHRAYRAAQSRVWEIEENSQRLTPEQFAAKDEIDAECDARVDAINEERRVRVAAITDGDELLLAEKRFQAATDAYGEFDSPAIAMNADEDALICAKSGLAIWEDEEIVEDPETGEVFLREALGLPPRKIDDEAEAA